MSDSTERCANPHQAPDDPLFHLGAWLHVTADGVALVRIAPCWCPDLSGMDLLAVVTAVREALAEIADGARTEIAQAN